MNVLTNIFMAGAMLALAACSSGPKPADWQLEAKTAAERGVAAYMEGNSRVEAVEFARALSEVSSTGRVDLTARLELLRCASRTASLVFAPCAGFERLRADAPAAERAYADSWPAGCSRRTWRCCLRRSAQRRRGMPPP